jgi:hypothetical protein
MHQLIACLVLASVLCLYCVCVSACVYVFKPAFILVDPATTSAPVTASMQIHTHALNGVLSLQLTPIVVHPIDLAYVIAPSTYGVRPDAAMPTHMSDDCFTFILQFIY